MTDFQILLLIAACIIAWLAWRISALRRELAQMPTHIQEQAQSMFEKWRLSDFEAVKSQQGEVARREAAVQLDAWKRQQEAAIRADAVQRSQSVIRGKITEHLIPYLPDFVADYDPKDARFIGSPVDFVVFDGLAADALNQIVFIEVKTGSSSLTNRERQIRDAVREQRVVWREMRLPSAPLRNSDPQPLSNGADLTTELPDLAPGSGESTPRTLAIPCICDFCKQPVTVTLVEGSRMARCPDCHEVLEFEDDLDGLSRR